MDILTKVVDNWALLAVGVSLLAFLVIFLKKIVAFFKSPFVEQKIKVKECLLSWVLDAESQLGKETGKAKLSLVYNWFVGTFPVLKNFISVETFSEWVDEALDEAKELLDSNEHLREIVLQENKKEDKE